MFEGKKIVIDLDGTICTQTAGGNDYFLAKPIPEVIQKVNELYERGYFIHIFTARGMKDFYGEIEEIEKHYRSSTRKWLDKNNVRYHILQFGKPSADFYVDDKSLLPQDFIDVQF